MNGNSSKLPTKPPLPLRGTSPKGGSEGCATLKITPKITKGESIPPPTGRRGFAFFVFLSALQAFSSGSGAARPATSETGREKTMPLAFLAMPSSL